MTDRPDPDIEHTLESSLQHHAASMGTPTGRFDDVLYRVDRRRNRRRTVAVLGSLAVVGLGVVGVAALGGDTAETPSAAEGPPITGPEASWMATTTVVPSFDGNFVGWACEGEFFVDDQPNAAFATTTTMVIPADETVPPDGGPQATYLDETYLIDTDPPDGPTRYFSSCTEVTVPTDDQYPAPTTTTVESYTEWDVRDRDTLSGLSSMFGTSAELIAEANGWPDGVDHQLPIGESIVIPIIGGLDLADPIAQTTTSTTVLPPSTTTIPPTTTAVSD